MVYYLSMTDQKAFLDLHHVFVDYRLSPAWSWLVGGTKKYFSALQDVTLQLPCGAQVTLYGAPGKGKSTLLRVLTGVLKPNRGTVRVNGRQPDAWSHMAAGYVSLEESEPERENGLEILTAYGQTHQVENVAVKIRRISDVVGLGEILHRPVNTLSTTERLKLNVARAALSDSPLVLLDDVADVLGAAVLKEWLLALFAGRTVVVATRLTAVADQLALPVLLLHNGTLAYQGTVDELALNLACQRMVDVWVEGLRYDLLRQLRQQTGVVEALLIPSNQFSGQRLRVTLRSSRYLPSLYDLISQAPVIKVQEIPPSLNDILARL